MMQSGTCLSINTPQCSKNTALAARVIKNPEFLQQSLLIPSGTHSHCVALGLGGAQITKLFNNRSFLR
jgi:hypothetical protein